MKKFIYLIFFYFFTFNYSFALEPTPLQIQTLPPYCKGRYIEDSDYQKWNKILRGDNVWMNHYCDSLIKQINCGMISSKKDRNTCFRECLSAYEYTFKNTSKKFILKPKLLYERGKIYLELGDLSLAEKDFLMSINLKPDTISPYIELSKIYLHSNNRTDAISILDKGLKHSPKSLKLKQQLAKIKGTK